MLPRYGVSTSLSMDADMIGRIDQSVEMLRRHLKDGHLVYGKAVLAHIKADPLQATNQI